MFERFTDHARQVVVMAQEEARLLDHNYIGTEHLLLALLDEHAGDLALTALTKGHVTLEDARSKVEELVGRGSQKAPLRHVPFTPRHKKVLELALRETLQLGHNNIGPEHLLLGLIREGEGKGAEVIKRLGGDLNEIRLDVIRGMIEAGQPVTGAYARLAHADRTKENILTEIALRELLVAQVEAELVELRAELALVTETQ